MSFAGGDWKALFSAAKQGNADEVLYWLKAGVDPNMQHVEIGTTALIIAVEKNHFDIVKLLVDGGADISVRSDWDKCTAIETARELGRRDIAAWLKSRERSPSS